MVKRESFYIYTKFQRKRCLHHGITCSAMPKSNALVTITGKTTEGNPLQAPCVFPFKYRGKLYSTCITKDHGTLWCSITEDFDKNREWRECPGERNYCT